MDKNKKGTFTCVKNSINVRLKLRQFNFGVLICPPICFKVLRTQIVLKMYDFCCGPGRYVHPRLSEKILDRFNKVCNLSQNRGKQRLY